MSATARPTRIQPVVGVARPAVRGATSDRGRALALFGPLLLFVHGILDWLAERVGLGSGQWVAALAGLSLAVAAVAAVALALLAAELREQTGRGPTAFAAVVTSGVGAGSVAGTAVARLLGLLAADLPAVVTTGGPVLVATGLAILLGRLVLAGRLPVPAALVTALGAGLLALPLDLLPLGALTVLAGLGPLLRRG